MKPRIIILAAALLAMTPIMARKRATTRKLRPAETIAAAQSPCATLDSIIPEPGTIGIYGYDKPLQATRESIFVTNDTDLDIQALKLRITYLDSSGRQLHEISRRIPADIPSRSTRKIDFPSWDTQKSFYYKDSRRPRTSAIPYDVRIATETIYFHATSD